MPRDNPPATRLVSRRGAEPNDGKILSIIASLPREQREGAPVFAGICNRAGDVYRRVELRGPVEFLLFAARMNAAGYTHESGARAGKSPYDAIFWKGAKRFLPVRPLVEQKPRSR